MPKYTKIPNDIFVRTDEEAFSRIHETIRANLSIAIENNDARSAMGYTLVGYRFAVIFDNIEELLSDLEDIGDVVDATEEYNGAKEAG